MYARLLARLNAMSIAAFNRGDYATMQRATLLIRRLAYR